MSDKFGSFPVLAFNDPWHDSSFFFADGSGAVHVESERFSRRKHDYINPILKFCELFPERVESFSNVVIQVNGELGRFMSRLVKAKLGVEDESSEPLQVPLHDRWLVPEPPPVESNDGPAVQAFVKHLMRSDVKLFFCGHHTAHAANAYFSSTLDSALVITLDGGGLDFWPLGDAKNILDESEFLAAYAKAHGRRVYGSVYRAAGNRCNLVLQFDGFSIGEMWNRVVTRVLQLKPGEEGTAMAMAALGDPRRFRPAFDSPACTYPQAYVLDEARASQANNWVEELRQNVQVQQDSFDVAAAMQAATERLIHDLLAEHVLPTDKNLCLAGGTFLNCQVTGKIRQWFPQLENIYIPPAPYDGGLSIGAAQLAHHEIAGRTMRLGDGRVAPYSMGRTYSRADVLSAVAASGMTFEESSDAAFVAAVAAGKVVCLFQQGSESGRRALGNRSIVAHPGIPGMKGRLNSLIKHREPFRPFAPMVLAEHAPGWFECDEKFSSPYMCFAVPVRPEVRDHIANVVHLDGTARVQTVHRDLSPRMHALLTTWHEASGLPVLLNTSFNDREPIVETPADALRTFARTPLDALYFADHKIMVRKAA